MSPEERASELAKWIPADIRRKQWIAIRDSIEEALVEEREACAGVAEEVAGRFRDDHGDVKGVCADIAATIRQRGRGRQPRASEA